MVTHNLYCLFPYIHDYLHLSFFAKSLNKPLFTNQIPHDVKSFKSILQSHPLTL